MKTETPKQREKVYRKTAERLIKIKARRNTFSNWAFACNEMGHIARKECKKETFPEFFLFKNRSRSSTHAWWDYQGYDFEPRVIALLLAAEMTRK